VGWSGSGPPSWLIAACKVGASSGILTAVSASAARRHPADLPAAMAAYVTRALSG
jgi:hypothetical protein